MYTHRFDNVATQPCIDNDSATASSPLVADAWPWFRMKKSVLFVFLTFLLSWPLGFVAFATFSPLWFATAITFMFTPMMSALIVQKLIYRQEIRSSLAVSFRPNRWFLIGWALPPALAIMATAASLAMPGIRLSLDPSHSMIIEFFGAAMPGEKVAELQQKLTEVPVHVFLLSLLGGMVAGVTINAVAGFGEELGWRGLLQSELAHLGFWRSSWIIGLIWGLWHTPFIVHGYNYPGHPVAGVFLMTAWTILFTPLIAHVRLKANSVIAAAIMHGTINGTAILPMTVLAGGDSLTVGTIGIPGVIVLALLNIGLYWLRNKTDACIKGNLLQSHLRGRISQSGGFLAVRVCLDPNRQEDVSDHISCGRNRHDRTEAFVNCRAESE